MTDEDRTVSSDEEDDGDDEAQGFSMANFMFGNVDSRGQLEGDMFDEVCHNSAVQACCNSRKRWLLC